MIINKKFLAASGVLPANFDYSNIMPYVDISERLWVIPLIGQEFYDELDEQVKNNNVSPENATLFTTGGLWMYLSYATALQALPFLYAHVSEVGITKGHSDNSDSVDLKDLTLLQSSLRSTVEYLKEQVLKFICEHSDSYPLAFTCQCECNCTCGGVSKLKSPQKYQQLYTTNRKCTDLI